MRKTILLTLVLLSAAWAQVVPVVTRSNGNNRHGVYLNETKITLSNVSQLKLSHSIRVPNDARGIEAQPLIMPGVLVQSDAKFHDLLVLTSMANDVLACDLHTGALVWSINLGRPILGSKAIDFWQINQYWGILSTGVIDPETQTLYVLVWSSPDGTANNGWHALHAINLSTGKETHNPLSMNPLSYDPGHGLALHRFAGQMRKQRSALLLETVQGRKTIFVASGSVLETAQAASGWVAAADITTWRFTASWAATGRYTGGGIWMAGQGPSSDADGNIYFLTGNGGFDGITDFSESFVKLHFNPTKEPRGMGSLVPADWWSPWSDASRAGQDPTLPAPGARPVGISGLSASTESGKLIMPVNHGHDMPAMVAAPVISKAQLAYGDQDLGSGSIVYIPKYGVLGGAGKDGIWYAVNAKNMGKTKPADFANSALNYAKLLSPPLWFTYACYKHNAQGQVIGFESAAPPNMSFLDFNYDNLTHHMHSTPIVFESADHGTMVFCFGENGNLRAWTMKPDGSLDFLANGAEQSSANSPRNPGGMPGAMLALSAHGTRDAIIWALIPLGDANREITQGYVAAYDATNFGKYSDGTGQIKTLWKSPPYTYNKFNVPVIDDGILIVPTYDGQVLEFTLP